MADPIRTATMYSSGVKKNSPATAGISLSENEWDSRRKWTTMTLASAATMPRRGRPRKGDGHT